MAPLEPSPDPPARSRRIPRLRTVLIALLGLAALAEGGIELWLRHPASIPRPLVGVLRQYYGEYGRRIIHAIPACARYDPGLLYTLRPGECLFANREFETRVSVNSLGVRDDEASLDGPEIVALGDSYAMGWGVAQEETFARRIERATGRKVLNAGVASYGTARASKLLDRVDATRLKTLIVQYNFTDVGENRAYYRRGGQLPAPEEARYEDAVSTARSRGRYFPGKHVLTVTAIATRRILAAPIGALRRDARTAGTSEGSGNELGDGPEDARGARSSDEPSEAWLFLNVIRDLASRFENVDILVLELSPAETLGREFMAAVRDELRQGEFESLAGRVRLLDMSERIGPDDVFILDEHLNAAGHALVADAIIERLYRSPLSARARISIPPRTFWWTLTSTQAGSIAYTTSSAIRAARSSQNAPTLRNDHR